MRHIIHLTSLALLFSMATCIAARARAQETPPDASAEQGISADESSIHIAADAGVSDATAEPADASAQYVPETAPVEREPVEPGERARQATVQSSELGAPSEQAVIEASPAQFNGVQPASTRLEELEKRWGMPAATTPLADGKRLRYQIAPFESVLVTIKNNVVDGIVVNLAQPIVADRLVQELKLGDIQPVPVQDESGSALGEAYPERGVVFSFAPQAKDRSTQQILLAPIDAQAFVMRAEATGRSDYAASLRDLDYAIRLAPHLASARFLRCQLSLDVGRYPQALRDAEEMVRVDDKNAEYRVTLATALAKVGQPQPALEQAAKAVELAPAGSALKAEALAAHAEALIPISDQDYRRAAELHQEAIAIAEQLTSDADPATRQKAQWVLLNSHLALARDIAWGAWKSKAEATPRWLEEAVATAAKTREAGDSRGDEEFVIAREALVAFVGLQGKLDPTPWAEAALTSGRQLIEGTSDPLAKSRWEWELGMALYDALQVYHMRKAYQPALEYGELAVQFLEQARVERGRLPGHAYMMGRLYFRIGSIHALKYRKHDQASPWFEKAVPLLEEPIPDSALADVGRQGETFVSIAVTYWEIDRREEAVRLTKEGLRLMDQAVDEGALERSALLVPYGNLARMHEQLGQPDEAQNYAAQAKRLEASMQR